MMRRTATGGFSTSFRATSLTVAMSSSAGTTSLTIPSLKASEASNISPRRMSSIAFFVPARRVSCWVAPQQGLNPRLTSGWPNLAPSAA